MASSRATFSCSACGASAPKWVGRCDQCGEWNTLTESVPVDHQATPGLAHRLTEIAEPSHERHSTGIEELDRVLGGGIMAGSVTLIGGEPGIGKSTLLMQVANSACATSPVLYCSAEESAQQVSSRAQRLGAVNPDVHVLSETDLDVILATIDQLKPSLVVVDSIQTVSDAGVSSIAGSLNQVRQCAQRLVEYAKSHEVAIMMIGQVTKDGSLAGPRALEHVVDAVLNFEGDRDQPTRMVRAVKNRFGSTNEIGIFAMGEAGLETVADPSAQLLAERNPFCESAVATVTRDGHRCMLVEIQALAQPSASQYPKRQATGVDPNRLNALSAILGRHSNVQIAGADVYVMAAGGARVYEPAADLAIATALFADAYGLVVPHTVAAFGEIGLTGEVRGVPAAESRIREAQRCGFDTVFVPPSAAAISSSLQLIAVSHVGDLEQMLIARSAAERPQSSLSRSTAH
jgi:DNA repair protein RadA/Sms